MGLEDLLGNSSEYDLDKVEVIPNSILNDKRIAYLGSSITLGACSLETSFVEYISKRNNSSFIKEAVSGTTLVNSEENSYIARLTNISPKEKIDLFICQLSTNDASKNKPLGSLDEKDICTVTGAIRYIRDYVKKVWGSPFIMFSNPYYHNDNYLKMVNRVKEMEDIYLIDMYFNKEFNDISSKDRALFMADDIHPTKAGYLKWWTPFIEQELYKIVKNR